MRVTLGGALAIALVVTAGLSADDKVEKIDAKKLVGKWEPKEAKEGGKMVIEFTKDGKISVSFDLDGKAGKLEGTYKVEGNKLNYTVKLGEKEETKTRTVSKLTATELVSKDEKGKEDTLIRVKK